MRHGLVLGALLLSLSACQSYWNRIKIADIEQGRHLSAESREQIHKGMHQDRVRYLLGEPLAESPFKEQRWDYVAYRKAARRKATIESFSVFFDTDHTVSRIETNANRTAFVVLKER